MWFLRVCRGEDVRQSVEHGQRKRGVGPFLRVVESRLGKGSHNQGRAAVGRSVGDDD